MANSIVKVQKGEWTPELRLERAPSGLRDWFDNYMEDHGDLEGNAVQKLNHCVAKAFNDGLSGAAAGKLYWLSQVNPNQEKLKSIIDGAIRALGNVHNNETVGQLTGLVQQTNGTHDIETVKKLRNGDIAVKFKARYSKAELERRELIAQHREKMALLDAIPDDIKDKYKPKS